MMKIGIFCFRTLYSQSASSVTVEKISSELKDNGIATEVRLLKQFDHFYNFDAFSTALEQDMIIYKTNFQDFEYGIRFFENIYLKKNTPIILIGPFACLNKERILKKYDFVHMILSPYELDEYLGNKLNIKLNSTIRNITDRSIENLEKGKYANIERSNGCIYKCNFCHIPLGQVGAFEKTAKEVVDEIELLNIKYGKKYFIFNDPIFWKGKKDNTFVEQLCDLIIEKNLNIYFMVYLALGTMIPEKLLDRLIEVGLVRVFFGIESITNDFQVLNPKKISKKLADDFIFLLNKKGVSYHIGFMLFHPTIEHKNIEVNIEYLWEINKLFRLGVIREKMRILPGSPNSNLLITNDNGIDLAYNYLFSDPQTTSIYNEIKGLIEMIDYRTFETFFTIIDTILAMMRSDGYEETNLKNKFDLFRAYTNDKLKDMLISLCHGEKAKKYKYELIDLYCEAESFFLTCLDDLKRKGKNHYFEYVPHGKEDLNVAINFA